MTLPPPTEISVSTPLALPISAIASHTETSELTDLRVDRHVGVDLDQVDVAVGDALLDCAQQAGLDDALVGDYHRG